MERFSSIFVIFACLLAKSSANYTGNICEANGVNPDGGLLPHESNCRLFYLCAGGHPVLMNCPENLEFNPNTLECDWPGQSGCVSNKTSELKIKSCIYAPEPVCPQHEPNKPAVLLPHPEDCGKFYYCDWGVLYERDCPSGLHFNANLKICDYPGSAHCECDEESTTNIPA